jgi:integrase
VLFRSTGGRGRVLTERPLYRVDVYRMIKRRAMAADFGDELTCHTFRATGLTNYLMNGGTLETGAEIAGHSSTRTTQIYDRRRDKVTQAEIERIRI